MSATLTFVFPARTLIRLPSKSMSRQRSARISGTRRPYIDGRGILIARTAVDANAVKQRASSVDRSDSEHSLAQLARS